VTTGEEAMIGEEEEEMIGEGEEEEEEKWTPISLL
jgi:hypothetical protein